MSPQAEFAVTSLQICHLSVTTPPLYSDRWRMKKILLIEDDLDLYELLKYNLEKAGFRFVGAKTGKGAIELCARERPDVILLDIMLPDCSGLEICTRVRSHVELAPTPIVFITARATEADRITGLELGANDYVVKPFSIRELITRVKVQLRPASELAGNALKAGALELDRARCQVRQNGKRVPLTATEFRLLEFLMSRPGIVFNREQLLNAIWGNHRAIIDRSVDVYILRLRKKLETEPAKPQLICSVRGFGYSFNPDQATSELDQVAARV
jgi:DNA-binding response OmpR family regulator